MRSQREFDRRKTFYALRTFRWENRIYTRGDKFPARDVTSRKLLVLFQNGRVGYVEDFRTNKVARQEVEIENTEVDQEEVAEREVESNPEVAQVVQDDDEGFYVQYQGKVFEINRNQIRDDGTLTAGGLKAYEAAE